MGNSLDKLEQFMFLSAKYVDSNEKWNLSLWYFIKMGTVKGMDEFVNLIYG